MADPITEPKSGFVTTEFWVNLGVVILGALITTGAIAQESTIGKIIGAVLMVASALGYTASRTMLKK